MSVWAAATALLALVAGSARPLAATSAARGH